MPYQQRCHAISRSRPRSQSHQPAQVRSIKFFTSQTGRRARRDRMKPESRVGMHICVRITFQIETVAAHYVSIRQIPLHSMIKRADKTDKRRVCAQPAQVLGVRRSGMRGLRGVKPLKSRKQDLEHANLVGAQGPDRCIGRMPEGPRDPVARCLSTIGEHQTRCHLRDRPMSFAGEAVLYSCCSPPKS
jgi:hypothetical protein